MSLSLPQDAEPFGTEWNQPGVYVLQYERSDDLQERVDRAFDHEPPWLDRLKEAANVLYVGEATNVMRRLEDHNNAEKRLTVPSRIGCEPVGIEAIEYHDSKEDAMHAEYNTAVRMARQTQDSTLVICNGKAL